MDYGVLMVLFPSHTEERVIADRVAEFGAGIRLSRNKPRERSSRQEKKEMRLKQTEREVVTVGNEENAVENSRERPSQREMKQLQNGFSFEV